MPNILVLYNAPTLPAGHADAAAEHDVLRTAETIAGYLGDAASFWQAPCGTIPL